MQKSEYKILQNNNGVVEIKINPNLMKLKNMFQKKSKVGFKPFHIRDKINFPKNLANLNVNLMISGTQSRNYFTINYLDESINTEMDTFTKTNFNNITTKQLKEVDFDKTIKSILDFNVRSALLILKNNNGMYHEVLNQSINKYVSQNSENRICIIDFNITNSLVEPFSYTNYLNKNFLVISFRELLNSIVKEDNVFLLGFKDLESDLIISDMFFIYIYERIFFQIIQNFHPSLIFLFTNNDILSNNLNSKFHLTGDCNYI